MKRFLITLVLAVGAITFSARPAFAIAVQDPIQQQDKKKDAKKDTRTVVFRTSMHCDNCVKKITENMSFVKGVKDLKTSLNDKLVTITYDPAKTDETTLAKAIQKLGYTAEKVPIKE
jgi:copper chaperone CopZ